MSRNKYYIFLQTYRFPIYKEKIDPQGKQVSRRRNGTRNFYVRLEDVAEIKNLPLEDCVVYDRIKHGKEVEVLRLTEQELYELFKDDIEHPEVIFNAN